ncbi:MAG: hypothetical protein GC191_09155 [Azospirillum sp.]|nr:hypothetical protein [Azospirillum sp.]
MADKGRPVSTGAGHGPQVRLSHRVIAALDQWRAPRGLSRPLAIAALVDEAIARDQGRDGTVSS